MPTILRLHSITGGYNCHISSKQLETRNPQQCIRPIRTQGSQQSRRPHVHGRQWGHSHQQWSGTQHIACNKSSDVIGCRGWTWRTVHQRQNGSLHAMHSWRNGTSSNLHPHTNQQFNCPRTTHKQNNAQGVEGQGHEIPLVELLQSTRPKSFLLETWNTKFGGLLDQASSSQPPRSFLATYSNLFKEHGKQIFCQENLIDTSICGTNGSTTKTNCSQRRLMAQRQGCVRLAGKTSWGKDNYPRPSPISNRILQNAVPTKAHSIVQ